jgi:hypothetical protein
VEIGGQSPPLPLLPVEARIPTKCRKILLLPSMIIRALKGKKELDFPPKFFKEQQRRVTKKRLFH